MLERGKEGRKGRGLLYTVAAAARTVAAAMERDFMIGRMEERSRTVD